MNAEHLRVHKIEAPVSNRRHLISMISRQFIKLRKEQNICIHALALQTGLPVRLLRALDSDAADDLDFHTLKQISEALAVDVAFLFSSEDLLSS
jgi:hypothetical protein